MKWIIIFILFLTIHESLHAQKQLMAHHPFDGNGFDISGNNRHASIFGCTITNNRCGNNNMAYYFNGLNNHILLAEDYDLPERTFAFWFYASSITGSGINGLLGTDHANSLYGRVAIQVRNTDKIQIYSGINDLTANIDAQTWYHVAYVQDLNVTKLYLNAVLIGTISTSKFHSVDGSNKTPVGINRKVNSGHFHGKMDDLRIYNYDLGISEIKQLYNNYQPNSLIAHHPFNDNADDISGYNNHATAHGTTFTTDRFNNIDSAYYFDGNNDYVLLAGDYDLPERTFAFWFYANSIASSGINGLLGTDHANSQYGRVALQLRDTNKIQIYTGDQQFTTTVSTHKWYHVAYVQNTTHTKLYLNGQLVNTIATSTFHSVDGSDKTPLGTSRKLNSAYFHGKMDELRIYNYDLADNEIQALYGDFNPNQLIASHPFNGNALDVSGNNKHGIVYDASPAKDRFGNTNSSYYFDGIDDYILLAESYDMPERSFSLWFYAEEIASTGVNGIFGVDNADLNFGRVSIQVRDQNKLEYHSGNLSDTHSVEEKFWYHLVYVQDNSETRIYLNNQLIGTIAKDWFGPLLIGLFYRWLNKHTYFVLNLQ
jgi:hypothetical protein